MIDGPYRIEQRLRTIGMIRTDLVIIVHAQPECDAKIKSEINSSLIQDSFQKRFP